MFLWIILLSSLVLFYFHDFLLCIYDRYDLFLFFGGGNNEENSLQKGKETTEPAQEIWFIVREIIYLLELDCHFRLSINIRHCIIWQVERILHNLRQYENPLEKYVDIMDLQVQPTYIVTYIVSLTFTPGNLHFDSSLHLAWGLDSDKCLIAKTLHNIDS